jgi:N-methylhydantoinase B
MTLDAIGLQVMAHAFAGLAEEMGAVLVASGTHLPDITMVHAIAVDAAVGGYTVVRAHHSDVGGSRPGSMPPHSTEVFEEGIVIPPVRWATNGVVQRDVERMILANVRTPDVRRGDLAAQLAACERGAERYRGMVSRLGRGAVEGAVTDLLDYAERQARSALAERLRPGRYTAEDRLESDGVQDRDVTIRVAVDVQEGGMTVDFSGTDDAVPGNVNCPLSVTRSAVLFVLRCLLDEDVPTNGGLHRVVSVRAPRGTVVNAPWPRAVASGNVETSQRIADVLFLALAGAADLPAQGQGTMNNVVLAGEGWTYYETLGGGQGASSREAGPSGMHVGMSNTRNTPIEVLELEHPVRVTRYALRAGSGGAGKHRGGVPIAEPAGSVTADTGPLHPSWDAFSNTFASANTCARSKSSAPPSTSSAMINSARSRGTARL